MKIVIIDYGAGNIANVRNAFEKIGVQVIVSDSQEEWEKADALVFPGVGSFGAAMDSLGDRSKALKDLISKGTPFLGICLGMQILMDGSEESPGVRGLGIIPGKARRFSPTLAVPQIGWNTVDGLTSPLFAGISSLYGYYLNSYYCDPDDSSSVAATSTYGKPFAAAFWKANIFATQFHPEKSGEPGLQILRNFIQEVKR